MSIRARCGYRWFVVVAAIFALSGCATTGAGSGSGNPFDPWEPANRNFYAVNESLDRAMLEPVANLYARLPAGLRRSITNFFDNASYPGTALNQLLQGKLNLALQDSVRFVFNTTLGIGGLLDVSTGFGLPRHDEDFGQTLAVWGVSEGFYIHYPLLGPSTVRDSPGIIVGALTDVLTYAAALPLSLLEAVDARANLAHAARIRDQSAFDPYNFTRDAYHQRRNFLIHDGNPPFEDFDEFEDEEVEADADA